MSLPITFSPLALEHLASLTDYIAEEWGTKASEKFKSNIKRTLKVISSQPYLAKASSLDADIRKAIISKQTSLFYQIHKEHIELLFFYDNRQEPIIE